MSEWREVKLGDLLEISHGYAFRGEYFASEGTNVLLTPRNFRAVGGLDVTPERSKYYVGPVDERFVLGPGDVVLAMTDLKQDAPILGAAGTIPATGRYLHNQRIGKVEIRDAALAREFVPWLLNSPVVRGQVRATATGATVRHTAPVRIGDVRVDIPNRAAQRRIAAVLAAFDELIEINERRIELLEDLARSLYREWFVRFRFPGHGALSASGAADGWVPPGWSVRVVQDLVQVVTDGVSPADVASGSRYLGLEHLPRRATTLREWGVIDSVKSRKLRFQVGDTLFGKIRPYFHKVVWAPSDGLASSDTIVFRARGDQPVPALVNAMLSSDALVAEAVATSNGTKMPRADPSALLASRVVFPPLGSALAQHAEAALGAFVERSASLACHNRALAATRDLLLPRLVTGRLDVADVDLGALLPAEPVP